MSKDSSGIPYRKIREILVKAIGRDDTVQVDYLLQGFSNDCFRVLMVDGTLYKVRIGGNNDVIDRDNEWTILKQLNIDYLYYDRENGDSVWRWIDGRTLVREDIDAPMLGRLVKMVEDIHSHSGEGVMFHDDLEFVGLFGNRLGSENLKLYLRLVEKYAEDRRCLCHNDISLTNLVYHEGTEQLHLIDYEWGRLNNPYWDYGNFVKEAALDEERVRIICGLTGMNMVKMYEFMILAAFYSIQLSYSFSEQTIGLDEYRRRLFIQADEYKRWLDLRG